MLRFAIEIDLTLTHQCISVLWFVDLSILQVSVVHGVFCLIMLIFPIATLAFLLRRRERLPERSMIGRFGTLYQSIKTHSNSTGIYTAIFLFKRLLFVCLVVFLNDYQLFKVLVFMWVQVFYLIWVGWSKPH